MVRLLIIIAIVCGFLWCYHNLDFSNIVNGVSSSVQNEKTIKAVHDKRQFDYNQEQSVGEN